MKQGFVNSFSDDGCEDFLLRQLSGYPLVNIRMRCSRRGQELDEGQGTELLSETERYPRGSKRRFRHFRLVFPQYGRKERPEGSESGPLRRLVFVKLNAALLLNLTSVPLFSSTARLLQGSTISKRAVNCRPGDQMLDSTRCQAMFVRIGQGRHPGLAESVRKDFGLGKMI